MTKTERKFFFYRHKLMTDYNHCFFISLYLSNYCYIFILIKTNFHISFHNNPQIYMRYLVIFRTNKVNLLSFKNTMLKLIQLIQINTISEYRLKLYITCKT